MSQGNATQPAGYKPVPVEAAKHVATIFEKSIVVILSYDPKFVLMHTTTYGVNAFEKEQAAAAGVMCTKAVGGDLSQKIQYEDFHKDYSPGRLRHALDVLRAVDHAISSLLAVRDGVTDELLRDLQAEVRDVLQPNEGGGS